MANRARGFTLVELMVALLIGLFVMAGIVQIFINTKRGSVMQEELARQQENERFAMFILARELRHAGDLGCWQVENLSGQVAGFRDSLTQFRLAVNGHEAVSSGGNGSWSPALPPSLSGVKPGSDVLFLHRAQNLGLALAAPRQSDRFLVTNLSSDGKVCSGEQDGYSGLCPGDTVIVSDCFHTDEFAISTLGLNNGVLSIHHADNLFPENAYLMQNSTRLFKGYSVAYFVKDSLIDGVTVPALYRSIGGGPPEELLEGVESMQVLYGVDNDGDSTPDLYLKASSVDFSTPNVVSVQIALLLRSSSEVKKEAGEAKNMQILSSSVAIPADRYMRRVASTTIMLRDTVGEG
ncbi:MAG TPA: prepilin-type N-terminal cleavage/methylation domain-containing protein [Gammaproteobacteria bacterium]|nr:prepilin-type N-terminal cleavage/methylation domain-containing protein [Gammaproteobacteria bacterium]